MQQAKKQTRTLTKRTRAIGKKMARARTKKIEERQAMARTLARKVDRSISQVLNRPAKLLGIPTWAAAALGAVASTGIVLGSIKLARAL